MSAIVTLEQMATWINWPTIATADEAAATRLQDALDDAEWYLTEQIGDLAQAAAEVKLRSNGKALVLPMTHLTSVTSVTDPTGEALVVDDLELDELAGIVYVPRAVPGQWTVVVQTRDIADRVANSVKLLANHIFGLTSRGKAAPVGRAFPPGEDVNGRTGFAIPAAVEQLIAPLRRLPG